MSKTEVLLLANNDWSNVGYEFAQSLKSVGVNADMYTWNRHPYKYYKEGIQFQSRDHVSEVVKNADIVVFMHSQLVRLDPDIRKKRCFVFHGGSAYRERFIEKNMIFNSFIEKSLIQTTNLFGLGAKNEVWMLPAVNTKHIIKRRMRESEDKIIVGHYPAQSIHKGTDGINNVINKLRADPDLARRFEYRHSTKQVSWVENIQRMGECDIYIENLSKGSWGVTALEAAALGCIVVTNFYEWERYQKEYGKCMMFISNDERRLEGALTYLLRSIPEALGAMGYECRVWAEEQHGYRATGERLKKIYGL